MDALPHDGDVTTFYAGAAEIELYRTETGNYRDNLRGAPTLWVALRPTGVEPPYELLAVTADPAEGEALTRPATDLVDTVPMPEAIRAIGRGFVAEHHVEQPFFKRKRDRADPEALARPRPRSGGSTRMSEAENFLTRWSRRKREAAMRPRRARRRTRRKSTPARRDADGEDAPRRCERSGRPADESGDAGSSI